MPRRQVAGILPGTVHVGRVEWCRPLAWPTWDCRCLSGEFGLGRVGIESGGFRKLNLVFALTVLLQGIPPGLGDAWLTTVSMGLFRWGSRGDVPCRGGGLSCVHDKTGTVVPGRGLVRVGVGDGFEKARALERGRGATGGPTLFCLFESLFFSSAKRRSSPFSESCGLWIEGAPVAGYFAYVGTVPHFTTWNADVATDWRCKSEQPVAVTNWSVS